MKSIKYYAILAGLLLSCSNNGVSTFGKVFSADITGMKYCRCPEKWRYA